MKRFEELIIQRGRESAELAEKYCSQQTRTILQAAEVLVQALRAGRKILVLGNGGSAADAQHFAAELINRFLIERRPLPAIALTTDTSVLTSIANDYSFEYVFSKQVDALGKEGDVLLAISTSGSSPNVLKALEEANRLSMVTIGMTGGEGSRMAPLCDICLTVPQQSTPRVQEVHHLVLHILCEILEIQLFSHGA